MDNQHVANLIERFSFSRYEIAYGIYEGAKWIAMHKLGFSYNSMKERKK